MIILYLIISLIFIHYFYDTYKIQNRVLLWFMIGIPPFLLVPYFWMPIVSPGSLFFWMPALPCLFYSPCFLIWRGLLILLRRSNDPLWKIKLIRPLLIVIMFILIFSNHSRSNTQANEYIFGLARQIQNRAEKQGSCPERWKGWPRKKFSAGEEKSYESEIEKLGITYRVFYRPAKDGRTFEVRLWTDIDKDLVVNGGVGKTLRAYYSDESGKEFPLE